MPQTDIFPDSISALLVPEYPVARDYQPGIVYDEADSGRGVSRLKRAPRRIHTLQFETTTDLKQKIEQWYDQFANSWFAVHDPVFGKAADGSNIDRYFSVRFSQQPNYSNKQNNLWDVQCVLTDVVGAALYEYPDPDAGHLSTFQEETAGYVVSGTWTNAADATAHGGAHLWNANTNTTDQFNWVYGGYGFRIWAKTDPSYGKVNVLLDLNPTPIATVDLYSAAPGASKMVFASLEVPLGLHTVSLVATNTKNGAATAQTIVADALEYMS